MNFISLKARQLHICEAISPQNDTLLHPVVHQAIIKYSTILENN
jgi:hypothetical protein